MTEEAPSVPDLVRCLAAVGATRDRDAFITLFAYFAPRLKSYFAGLSVQPGAADDLVQDMLIFAEI